MEAPPIIFEATSACRRRFEECRKIPALMNHEWAENRLADFNLWAASIGASARARASLDSRLALKPTARDVIANLLRLLKALVEECKELGLADTRRTTQSLSVPSDDEYARGRKDTPSPEKQPERSFSPWPDESSSDSESDSDFKPFSPNAALSEAMKNTEGILNQLTRIAVTIRRAGTRARLQKADQLFRTDDYLDLRSHLNVVVLSRPPFSDEQIDLRRLSRVQQRLINCNLKRRNRFIYAQKHSKGLGPALGNSASGIGSTDPKDTPLTSDLEACRVQKQAIGAPPGGEAFHLTSVEETPLAPAGAVTTASAVSSSLILPQNPVPSQAATTQVSSTGTKLTYPYPPKIKTGTQFFKCPCCCQTLPAMISEGGRWRKHIAGDLCPYTCILDDCPKPEVLYTTKEAWRKHLAEEHQTVQYWVCFACGDSEQFLQEDAFVCHVREKHYGTVSGEQIPTLTSVCKRSTPVQINTCPLCNLPAAQDGEVGRDALIDHIAEHVHSFSLRALPWAPTVEEENEERINHSVQRVQEWFLRWPILEEAVENRPVRVKEERLRDSDNYFEYNQYFADSSGSDSLGQIRSTSSKERDLESLRAEGLLTYSDSQDGDSDVRVPEDKTNKRNSRGEVHADVGGLKDAATSTEHRGILDWLSKIDPSSNYKRAREQHTPTTGDWFLKGNSYAKWINGEVPMLWLHGIPGCGKTVISSTIIDNLWKGYIQDSNAHLAYFYFDINDIQKQTVRGCLGSLLRQLSERELPVAVRALYKQTQEGYAQPGFDALTVTLKTVLQQASPVFLVFDALDECKEVRTLMGKIAEVKGWGLPGVRILATSRREVDIVEAMDALSPQSVCLEAVLVDGDIKTFVKQSCKSDRKSWPWSGYAEVQQEIEDTLENRSNGILNDLRQTLASTPKALDLTYGQILLKIDKKYSQMALKILQWLVYSARPLQVKEAAEALAVDVEANPRFDAERRLIDPRNVLAICSSLVTTTTERMEGSHSKAAETELRLAHFSVREFLMSDRIQDGPARQYSTQEIPANVSIAEICLAYLLQFDKDDSLTSETVKDFPLARYAAQYWTQHARVAKRDASTLHRLIMELFLSKRDAYVNWIRLFDPDSPYREPDIMRGSNSVATPLYYASLAGLAESVRLLLEAGADVNAQGGRHGNAIEAASFQGHDEAVQLLLEKGADVNAQWGEYGNALQAASFQAHDKIVQQLLEKGSDVNAQGGRYGNALQAASLRGHDKIVQQLLEKGAYLLEKGAYVNAQGGECGNALQAASLRGHDKIVQQLLEKGADVNAQGGEYGNALQAASFQGHDKIVEQLLEKGAYVNAQGGRHGNALQAASFQGHGQIVQLLKSALQSQQDSQPGPPP
ncbi:hypothetical protein FGG08_005309 [Glutinoglossum americanum]|uniref:Uncharacterized protein n=1 Tax=Glutinoglossum americanum TaxID=1670608 RepID=A0A9P8L1Y9_9PEZI|nr:hypothetical protein FGG08_005309 [Glutinoglossum americanum]